MTLGMSERSSLACLGLAVPLRVATATGGRMTATGSLRRG
jgi:hypothetical protein